MTRGVVIAGLDAYRATDEGGLIATFQATLSAPATTWTALGAFGPSQVRFDSLIVAVDVGQQQGIATWGGGNFDWITMWLGKSTSGVAGVPTTISEFKIHAVDFISAVGSIKDTTLFLPYPIAVPANTQLWTRVDESLSDVTTYNVSVTVARRDRMRTVDIPRRSEPLPLVAVLAANGNFPK